MEASLKTEEPEAVYESSFNNKRKVPFFFSLKKDRGRWALAIVDRRGIAIEPDYRQFTGVLRQVLREFTAALYKDAGQIIWATELEKGNVANTTIEPVLGPVVYNPRSHLLELALSEGLVIDAERNPIGLAEGSYGVVLHVRDTSGGAVILEPRLVAEDGSELIAEAGEGDPGGTGASPSEKAGESQGGKEKKRSAPVAISSQQVLWNSRVYTVKDLGPQWSELEYLGGRTKQATLPSYLALALSRFPDLAIRYESYRVEEVGELETRSALIFKEIDPYGYLHIRPVSYIEGYPPGFFEDQEIVKVVEVDGVEKILTVAEVVFPVDPVEKFREIVGRSGKNASLGVYEEQGLFILAPEFASTFISAHITELIDTFVLLESQVLGAYKVRVVQPKIKLRLSSGINFLGGSADVDVEGQEFSYGRFLEEYRRSGYVALSNGDRAYPEPKHIKRLERLIRLRTRDDRSADKNGKESPEPSEVEISFFDIPVLTNLTGIEADGKAWQRAESFYQGLNKISQKKGNYSINGGSLRPYQEYGAQWLEHLGAHQMGGCLADDMGLGKTIQVIALLRRAYAQNLDLPTLILLPRSLIYNWQSELQRFAPELSCYIYYGNDRDAGRLESGEFKIILSSYSTARIDIGTLEKISFAYLILDESQTIKNSEAKTSRAVFSLRANQCIALSGTPVENNLGELYSLFHFLNPALLGKSSEFMRRYMGPIQENGDQDALRELKAKIYPFILRRLKKDVLQDLPPKTEQTVRIELDRDHLAVYNRRRVELADGINKIIEAKGAHNAGFAILQALTELRRLAGVPETDGEYGGISAKREYLIEMVENLVAEGHKCLIFSNYLATVDLVSQDLASRGIGNLIMTGATGDRQSLVQRFQNDPHIRAFIMTLKTGGVGLNLTAADYVFIFDPWWNRSAEAQAVDRTHRIGQTKAVFSYRMIAKDTIEEKILELQERKVDLVSSVLSADADLIKSLSAEDIAYLLGKGTRT